MSKAKVRPRVAAAGGDSKQTPALQMTDVRKIYRMGDTDVRALDRARLTIGAKEIVALVGPSGSGKTTLCSIAGGILSATAGVAQYDSTPL